MLINKSNLIIVLVLTNSLIELSYKCTCAQRINVAEVYPKVLARAAQIGNDDPNADKTRVRISIDELLGEVTTTERPTTTTKEPTTTPTTTTSQPTTTTEQSRMVNNLRSEDNPHAIILPFKEEVILHETTTEQTTRRIEIPQTTTTTKPNVRPGINYPYFDNAKGVHRSHLARRPKTNVKAKPQTFEDHFEVINEQIERADDFGSFQVKGLPIPETVKEIYHKRQENITDDQARIMEENYAKLKNPEYQIKRSLHGITLTEIGKAYIFHNFYEQFFKIEIPIFDESEFQHDALMNDLALQCNKLMHLFCSRTSEVVNCMDTLYVNNVTEREIYARYRGIIQDTYEVLQSSLDGFKDIHIKRDKRFLPILAVVGVAAAVGALAYEAYEFVKCSNHDRETLFRITEELAGNLTTVAEGVVNLGEEMIGLTKVVASVQSNFDRKFDMILNLMQEKHNLIKKQLTIIEVENLIRERINLMVFQLQNLLTLKLEQIRQWDQIFISLHQGKLSRHLISYSKLKYILSRIAFEVRGSFELGITEGDSALYYTMPIVAHVVKEINNKFELTLQLRVPLKSKRLQSEYFILKPTFNAFPCSESSCIIQNRKTKNLLSFQSKNKIWLINSLNYNLDHEINSEDLECQDHMNGRICYTFFTVTLQPPSICTKAMFDWNEAEIVTTCGLRERHRDEYRALQLSHYQYLVHKNVIKEYSVFCDNVNPQKYVIKDYAEVFNIPNNCDVSLPDSNQFLNGFYSSLRKKDQSFTIRKVSYHSDLIPRLEERLLNISSAELPEPLSLRGSSWFNMSYLESFDDNTSEHIYTQTLNIESRIRQTLNKLNSTVNQTDRKTTTYSYLTLFKETLHVFTTIVVIFGVLSYTRNIGLFGGVLIIEPQGISAFSTNSFYNLFDDSLFNVFESIGWFLNLFLLVVFIILLVLYCKFAFFRTIRISVHYGQETDHDFDGGRNAKFSLILNIRNTVNFFRHIKVENIYVKVPITKLKMKNVTDVKIKTSLNTFYITRRGGQKTLALVDAVHLLAINTNGSRIRDANQQIEVSVKDIIWTSLPKPQTLQTINHYDLVFVTVMRNLERQSQSDNEGSQDADGYLIPKIF